MNPRDAERRDDASRGRRAAIRARERGLLRVRQVTRWTMAAALAASGALALVAARAFHGHSSSAPAAPAISSSATTSAGPSAEGSASPALAQPNEVPSATVAPPVAVSGGS